MSELRRDREWEHWPERRQDGGVRRHLRDLFHPTLGEDEVEQAIAAHAHDLELRAAQLADTIADLERREERTRELRTAVEQMLRRGSAELDERHAELTELAGRLSDRESLVAETEEMLAGRRRELGAVELHRAALERREETLAERERALDHRAEEITAREHELEAAGDRALELDEREHTLTSRANEIEALQSRVEGTLSVVEREQQLLSERENALLERERELDERETGLEQAVTGATTPPPEPDYVALVLDEGRYRLVSRDDGPPAIGSEIVVDETAYRIVRLGASPLPGDRRRCAFAEVIVPPAVS
jgi:DNA repair exonuclease SbcCD ATPase subunit